MESIFLLFYTKASEMGTKQTHANDFSLDQNSLSKTLRPLAACFAAWSETDWDDPGVPEGNEMV